MSVLEEVWSQGVSVIGDRVLVCRQGSYTSQGQPDQHTFATMQLMIEKYFHFAHSLRLDRVREVCINTNIRLGHKKFNNKICVIERDGSGLSLTIMIFFLE